MVDGDQAYFRAPSRSVKRLRHTDAVQVTPCGVLGFFNYGPPLDAIARPLSGEEASLVAAELDCRHLMRRRFLIRLPRRQVVCYELVADDAAGDQDGPSGERSASLITRVRTSQGIMHADAATPTSMATVCTPPAMSRPCPSDYKQITTVSMSLPAPQASRRSTGGS